MIVLHRYMGHITTGTLVHGPLIGWAYIMGDEMTPFDGVATDGTKMSYLMPRRTGLLFQEYPWSEHGIQDNMQPSLPFQPHSTEAMPSFDTIVLNFSCGNHSTSTAESQLCRASGGVVVKGSDVAMCCY